MLAGYCHGEHRQEIDCGDRHHLPPQRLELGDQGGDADRHGLRGRRAGDGQRDDEFVPGDEETEQRRYAEAGSDSGTTMRTRMPSVPRPSMRAASTSSFGKSRKKPVRIQIISGKTMGR